MDELEKSLFAIQKLRNLKTDEMNAYLNFNSRIKNLSSLDGKSKQLILIALSIFAQCESCILMNVSEAKELGITDDEILDSCLLAVSMGGGPKMMFMKYVFDALDA